MRTLLIGIAIWLCALCAHAEQRLALVVGIDSYENIESLQKATTDARTISATLDGLGFDVTTSIDANRRVFNRTLLDFATTVQPGDEVVFYFAGHGIEVSGRNFLLPSDVPPARPGDEGYVVSESIAVDWVLSTLQGKGARLVVMLLDACRENPFPPEGTRSVGGGAAGLARMDPPEGTFILFSAGTGQSALDRLSNNDPNPNSVFTRKLLPLLREPGLPIHELVRQVRTDVRELAKSVQHNQFPAYYDQLSGVFSFNPSDNNTPLVNKEPEPAVIVLPKVETALPDPCDAARLDWKAFSTTRSISALETFSLVHSKCPTYVSLAKTKIDSIAAEQALTEQPSSNTVANITRGDMCSQLWYQRNLIFHNNGFCFSTARAKSVFDTSQCTTRSPTLSPSESAELARIKSAETANGC